MHTKIGSQPYADGPTHFKAVFKLICLISEFLHNPLNSRDAHLDFKDFYAFLDAFRNTPGGEKFFYEYTHLPRDTGTLSVEKKLLAAWQAHHLSKSKKFAIFRMSFPYSNFFNNLKACLIHGRRVMYYEVELNIMFEAGQLRDISSVKQQLENYGRANINDHPWLAIRDTLFSGIRHYYMNALLATPVFIFLLIIFILNDRSHHNSCLTIDAANGSNATLGGDCDGAGKYTFQTRTCNDTYDYPPCGDWILNQTLPVYPCKELRSGNYSLEFSEQMIALMLQACSQHYNCLRNRYAPRFGWIQSEHRIGVHCGTPSMNVFLLGFVGGFFGGGAFLILSALSLLKSNETALSFFRKDELPIPAWVVLSILVILSHVTLPLIAFMHMLGNMLYLGVKSAQAGINTSCFSNESAPKWVDTQRFFTLTNCHHATAPAHTPLTF
jgi:hypothetical protein